MLKLLSGGVCKLVTIEIYVDYILLGRYIEEFNS